MLVKRFLASALLLLALSVGASAQFNGCGPGFCPGGIAGAGFSAAAVPTPWYGTSIAAVDCVNNKSYTLAGGEQSTAAAILTVNRNSNVNVPNSAGVYTTFGSNTLARSDLGCFGPVARTNRLWNVRNLTVATGVQPWVLSGVTAVLNQVGITGASNTATLLTATGANGTATQAVVDATLRIRIPATSIKCVTCNGDGTPGSAVATMTINGGTPYTLISQGGSTTTFTRPTPPPESGVALAGIANPIVVITILNSGDSVVIDAVQLEDVPAGTAAAQQYATEPIFSTTANGVRLATVATLTDVSNISLIHGGGFVEYTSKGNYGEIRNLFTITTGVTTNLVSTRVNASNITESVRIASPATQVTLLSQSTVDTKTIKTAFRFQGTNFGFFYSPNLGDGFAIGPVGATPVGTPVVGFGISATTATVGTSPHNGMIRQWQVFNTAPSDAAALTWTGNTYPALPAIADGTVYTPVAGLSWPATKNGIAVPQSITWSAAQNKFIITGDPALTNYVNPAIATATPCWADVTRPDNAGDCLTAATAKRDINAAITTANGDGQTCGKINIVTGNYYQANSINGSGVAVEPTKCMGFFGIGGKVSHWATGPPTWALSSGTTYSTTAQGGKAYDKIGLDNKGLFLEIPILADKAAVDASVQGWAQVAGTVYLKRPDGLAPTAANTFLAEDINVAQFATNTSDLYFENFDAYGGQVGAFALLGNNANRNVVFNNSCASYAGTDVEQRDNYRIETTTGLAILNNPCGGKAWKDHISGHEGGGTTLAMLVLNPTGWYNGHIAVTEAAVVSTNWQTAHEAVKFWSLGGEGGYGINGDNVAMVQDTANYFVRPFVFTAIGTNSGVSGISASDSAQLWCDTCGTLSQGTTFSYSANANARPPPYAQINKHDPYNVFGTDQTINNGIVTTY